MIAAALALAGGTALWAEGRQKESLSHPDLPLPTSVNFLPNDTDYLKGLKGVQVVVNDLDNDAKSIGLTLDRLQTATELALRRNRIRVLTYRERLEIRGNPTLHVNINAFANVFYVDVSLAEAARLERSPRIAVVSVRVWEKSIIGAHGRDPDFIVKSVEQLVERFCNDYLKANPTK